MRYWFALFVLLSSLLLSACGNVEDVRKSTVQSVPLTYTGVYRLLEPGEVERFLRDHPEQKQNLPQMLETSRKQKEEMDAEASKPKAEGDLQPQLQNGASDWDDFQYFMNEGQSKTIGGLPNQERPIQ